MEVVRSGQSMIWLSAKVEIIRRDGGMARRSGAPAGNAGRAYGRGHGLLRCLNNWRLE